MLQLHGRDPKHGPIPYDTHIASMSLWKPPNTVKFHVIRDTKPFSQAEMLLPRVMMFVSMPILLDNMIFEFSLQYLVQKLEGISDSQVCLTWNAP